MPPSPKIRGKSINYEFIGDSSSIYNGGLQKITEITNDKYLIQVGEPLLFEKVNNDDIKTRHESKTKFLIGKFSFLINRISKNLNNK